MASSEMFAQLYLISALLFVLFRANRSFTIIIFFQERVYGFIIYHMHLIVAILYMCPKTPLGLIVHC